MINELKRLVRIEEKKQGKRKWQGQRIWRLKGIEYEDGCKD